MTSAETRGYVGKDWDAQYVSKLWFRCTQFLVIKSLSKLWVDDENGQNNGRCSGTDRRTQILKLQNARASLGVCFTTVVWNLKQRRGV